MRPVRALCLAVPFALLLATLALSAAPAPTYVKKATHVETVVASLKASGLPTLDGDWYFIGPFDNTDGAGFDAVYPPEKEIDLTEDLPRQGRPQGRLEDIQGFSARPDRQSEALQAKVDDCVSICITKSTRPPRWICRCRLGSDDTLSGLAQRQAAPGRQRDPGGRSRSESDDTAR